LLPVQFGLAGVALALQPVAFVEVHVSVDALPLATLVGFAVSETVGGGLADTVTVALWLALPPGPEQFRVKLVVAASAPVD
jgi:hypothetical protein